MGPTSVIFGRFALRFRLETGPCLSEARETLQVWVGKYSASEATETIGVLAVFGEILEMFVLNVYQNKLRN